MKTFLKPISLTLAAFVFVSGATAHASLYLRPGVSLNKVEITYSAPGDASETWSGNKAGLGLSAGFTFGPNESHDLGLTVGRGKLTDTSTVRDSSFVETTRLTGTLTPLLLTYRYTFGAAEAPLRFYIGPSLGWLSLEIDGLYTASSGPFVYNESFNEKERGFAHGAHTGITWKLARNWCLDLGLAYTRSNIDFPYDDEPGGYEMDVEVLALTSGVTFRF